MQESIVSSAPKPFAIWSDSRWATYLKERSPIGAMLFIGVSQTLASQGALGAHRNFTMLALGTVGIAWTLTLMRLMDEKKDFAKDQIAHPDRPLPRGLLTLSEVHSMVSWNTFALLAGAAALAFSGFGLAGTFLAATTLFSVLMYNEFWMPELLNRRVFLNAIVHQPVVLLMYGFTNAIFKETSFFSRESLGIAVAGIGASFTFEICRKLDPTAPEILRTYLRITGKAKTLAAIFVSLAVLFMGGVLIHRPVFFGSLAAVQAVLATWAIYYKPKRFKAAEAGSVLVSVGQMYGPWLSKI